MSISKEERQQARIDIRSWGADEKPELVERLLNALDEADSEKADLQRENQRLGQSLANIVISNEPPTEADIQRAHELVERGLIDGG